MSVLVTGGAGFIGSHTVEALLARGERVIAIDNFTPYYNPERKRLNIQPFLAHPAFRLVDGDIRDITVLARIFDEAASMSGESIDRIVHLGAMPGVRASIKDPLSYMQVNVNATQTLAELATRHGIQHFVFASSSSVYGATAVPYLEEASTDKPLSPYATTKKMGEVLLYTYHHLYKMPVTVLRFFTVYGPRGRPDMAVYLFTDWIAKGQTVKLYGDGSQGRDYTYVTDTVSGIVAALYRPNGYRIYNLGNSRPQPNARLIEIIEEALERRANIVHQEYPALDPQQTCADITRASADLGYNPQVSLEDGVRRFVQWYLRHAFVPVTQRVSRADALPVAGASFGHGV